MFKKKTFALSFHILSTFYKNWRVILMIPVLQIQKHEAICVQEITLC